MPVRHAMKIIALCSLAAPATAHPHIFIDTAFDLIFDEEGRLEAVRVEWTYDALYSLLLVEENDLDADGDGMPEQDRLDAFAGGDVDWAAGFPGHFTVTVDGAPVILLPPDAHAASWRDDRYVTSHVHPLENPVEVSAHDVVARAYDPSYFVAYDVPSAPGVVGREDCRLSRDAADREAARQEYGDELAAVDTASDPYAVMELDDIGILFADRFVLTCAASS